MPEVVRGDGDVSAFPADANGGGFEEAISSEDGAGEGGEVVFGAD